jgi:hypothetical protein
MKQQLELIGFATMSLISVWMVFVSIAEGSVFMGIGAVLSLSASVVLTWAQTKVNSNE